MKYCMFPSTEGLISIQHLSLHFLSLTPEIKHGESGYRDLKKTKQNKTKSWGKVSARRILMLLLLIMGLDVQLLDRDLDWQNLQLGAHSS